MLKVGIRGICAGAAVVMLAAIFAYHSGNTGDRPPAAAEERIPAGPPAAMVTSAAKAGRSFEIERRRLSIGKELDLYLARSRVKWTKDDKEDVIEALMEIENRYGYRPMLFLKLMKVESNFKIDAISRDGAMGLCQIQPETAKNISLRMGSPSLPSELLFDPVINLKLSAHYINFLESKYKALPKALSAYNMGPGAFSRVYGEGGIPKGAYHDLLSEN